MTPLRIRGATHYLGPPAGWKPEKDGDCAHLAVRVEDGCSQSAWEPTPKELEILNAGGSVMLRVAGGQPPVMIWAQSRDEE